MATTETRALVPALVGLATGLLVALPLVGLLLEAGSWIYLLPLGVLIVAAGLRALGPTGLTVDRRAAAYALTFSLFFSWMSLSAVWTVPHLVVTDELGLLAGLIAFVAVATLVLDPPAVEVAISWTIAASVGVALYVFWLYLSEGTLRGYGTLSGHYLLVAQIVGLGAVFALLRAMARPRGRRRRPIFAAAILLPALALSLARGALLSTMLVALVGVVYVSLRREDRRRSFRQWARDQLGRILLFGAVFGGLAVLLGGALRVERTRSRLERLFSGRELAESARTGMWREAWEGIGNAPFFGHGLGSSGLVSGAGENLYPHNWALQVWVDGGLVGLSLCLATLSIPILLGLARMGRWRPGEPADWLAVGGGLVFLLLEYGKSSDFYSARLIFLLGVMLICASREPETA